MLLFHVKSSFRSWDIYIFVLTFWLCRETAWLEIYDVTGWTSNNENTHIAQYLKKQRRNQDITWGFFFVKNHAENEARGSSRPLKASRQDVSFNIFWITRTLTCNKNKHFRLFIQRNDQFWFLQKGPGLAFSTNWVTEQVSLSGSLYFLRY